MHSLNGPCVSHSQNIGPSGPTRKPRLKRPPAQPGITGRSLIRSCRQALYTAASENWHGTRAGLRRRVRELIKPMRARVGWMLRIVREARFAALVAGAVLATGLAGLAHAAPIELSDIAAGIGGVAMDGEFLDDYSGRSVSYAGDVNGDGLSDVIVGADGNSPHSNRSGRSYVVFGKSDNTLIQLSDVAAGTGGFAIDGEVFLSSFSGASVSAAGDVNGDGFADLIVGAPEFDPVVNGSDWGRAYVIFGKNTGEVVQLSAIAAGSGGFAMSSEGGQHFVGLAVSGAGDVNGDGLADVIVSAYRASANGNSLAGRSYVVFGKSDPWLVELSDVAAGTGGFAINGANMSDFSGIDVSGGGDINGDGLADLTIRASEPDQSGSGRRSYVVFGKATGTAVELSDVEAGTGGFLINGIPTLNQNGRDISVAGDVNGDGLADVIIGLYRMASFGRSYVIFGKASGTAVELSDIDIESGGFRIIGESLGDQSGWDTSAAGDVNGDGLADLIISAYRADPNGIISGKSYVVYGKVSGVEVQLSDVSAGIGGFVMHGEAELDKSGYSVSKAGDFNGDGSADLIVGAWGADFNASQSGRSYVIFGPSSPAVSGPYVMKSLPGDGAFGMVVPVTDFGNVARVKIDFNDSNLADNGSGGASTETVIITRSKAGLTNLVPTASVADVTWQITSDRSMFSGAGVTLKYLDGEISGIGGAESNLAIFTAPASSGPWVKQISTVDAARNEVSATVTDFSFFAIGDASSVIAPTPIPTPTLTPTPTPTSTPTPTPTPLPPPVLTTMQLSDIRGGTGGFAIDGEAADDYSGRRVSGAGDVNGDGLADLIVGAATADAQGLNSGRSYVIFGKPTGTLVKLSDIAAGGGGFAMNGEEAFDNAGNRVSNAGDVNGDGFDDVIVSASLAGSNGVSSGRSYIVFGKAAGTLVELSDIAAGIGGFAMDGEVSGDQSGGSLAAAGDVNGDGLADVIIGAWGASFSATNSGRSYVVFGKASGTLVQLSNVAAGTGGFAMDGEVDFDKSGTSVSGAGDVNGDGLSDLFIGANSADPNGTSSGRGYVVFGKTSGTLVQLSDIAAGSGGFAMDGDMTFDSAGVGVSIAGDVNGDGLADLIIGASGAGSGTSSGRSYIVFGKSAGTLVNLSDITAGIGGFAVNGDTESILSGRHVSAAGDINGDGMADLAIGTRWAHAGGYQSGRSYLVLGKATGTPIELSDITVGVGGFAMDGEASRDRAGRVISSAGDVNGDGLADLIVGAYGADTGGLESGSSYVVFSPETAAASGTYKARSRIGDGAGGDPVVPTVVGDSRCTIDYSDEDTGDNGAGGASTETVVLTRSKSGISNLNPAGDVADVVWQVTTDRVGFTDAKVTLKYLDSEIAGISGVEADLTIFKASAVSGPWTEQSSTVDAARNEISATVSGFSFFVIAKSGSVPVGLSEFEIE